MYFLFKGSSSSCCNQKTVGGVKYSLVSREETNQFGCIEDCIYKIQGDNSNKLYCFSAGNLQVDQCEKDDSTLTSESAPSFSPTSSNTVHENTLGSTSNSSQGNPFNQSVMKCNNAQVLYVFLKLSVQVN